MADPSDILSAEQLEATVATVNGIKFGVSTLQARAIDRILRHLRALAAPADGEALGRDLFFRLHPPTGEPVVRRDWEKETRAPWVSAALHLHAIGHAAGALSREREMARLTAELAEARATIGAAHAEIARWCRGAGVTSPESLASLLRDNLRALATARADGAREERERILRKLKRIGYPDAVAAFERAKTRRARGGR